MHQWDFDGAPVVKNLPCNTRDGLILIQGTKTSYAMKQLRLCSATQKGCNCQSPQSSESTCRYKRCAWCNKDPTQPRQINNNQISVQFSSVMSNSLRPHGPQHTKLPQSITKSRHLLKLMSIESVMPSNHLILCHPLLLPPSVFPSIRVFSNESAVQIRWPKN